MQITSNIYRNILFACLLFALFIPLIESTTHLKGVKPLNGAITKTNNDTIFTISSWLRGDYQRKEEAYLDDSLGFRNIFIRLRNQFDYSLFNKAHAKNIIAGKNGYLFETHYIDGHCGSDFIGMDSINNVMGRLKYLNDTLTKLHKNLVLIFTPNKADFYPEYLPDTTPKPALLTNYKVYLEEVKKSGIPYINFNSYFIANKNKSKYLLEPKNGAHWSMYGVALAGDSIVKYIDKIRNITMPHAKWNNITVRSDTLTDVDIENTMNLLFNLSSPPMAYPNIKFENSTGTRPNVLVVGDSYYWGLVNGYHILDGFSTQSDFWYYFKQLEHKEVSQAEIKNEIAKEDVIIIIATAHNWGDIGWGFIESSCNMFRGITPENIHSPEFRNKINEVKESIKAAPEWYAQIEKSAEKSGISIDSSLTLNAIWVLQHKH